jgi:hypothetical protein
MGDPVGVTQSMKPDRFGPAIIAKPQFALGKLGGGNGRSDFFGKT